MIYSASSLGLRSFSTMIHNYRPSHLNCAKELLQQKLATNHYFSLGKSSIYIKKWADLIANYPKAEKMTNEIIEICNTDNPFDVDLQKKMNAISNIWKQQRNILICGSENSLLYEGIENLDRERKLEIEIGHIQFCKLLNTYEMTSDVFNNKFPYYPIKNQIIPQLDKKLLPEVTFDILYSECSEEIFALFIEHRSQNDPEINLSLVTEEGKSFLSGGKIDIFDNCNPPKKAWVIGEFPENKKSNLFEWKEKLDLFRWTPPEERELSQNLLVNFINSEQKVPTLTRYFPPHLGPNGIKCFPWEYDLYLSKRINNYKD